MLEESRIWEFSSSEAKAFDFFVESNFIKLDPMLCPHNDCLDQLSIKPRNKTFLRCSRCGKGRSVFRGKVIIINPLDTFLLKKLISLDCLIYLMYVFCIGRPFKEIIRSRPISPKTIFYYFDVFRGFLSSREGTRIGGPGHIVEIDETKVSKRKYNRGRLLRHEWIIGAFDRSTKRVKLAIVTGRDQVTINKFINDNIEPGSTLITEEWRRYSEYSTAGFWHVTINHSRYYVNPRDSSIHTNTIERLWRTLKERIPKNISMTRIAGRVKIFENLFNNEVIGWNGIFNLLLSEMLDRRPHPRPEIDRQRDEEDEDVDLDETIFYL